MQTVPKGEIPKVEPLQPLPPSTQPNYNHNVQSGQFETKSNNSTGQNTNTEQVPIPAPKIVSGNNSFWFFFVLVLVFGIVAGYFIWKKVKLKL